MPVITHSADNDNFKFRMASAKGHLETVKLLLSDSRVDPASNDNYAIGEVSTNGHLETFKLLLSDSRVNPAAAANYIARDDFSMGKALKNEHHEITYVAF